MAAALWPLLDEINGAGVAGGGGSTAGATKRGGEDSGGEDVADGGADWRDAVVVDQSSREREGGVFSAMFSF